MTDKRAIPCGRYLAQAVTKRVDQTVPEGKGVRISGLSATDLLSRGVGFTPKK